MALQRINRLPLSLLPLSLLPLTRLDLEMFQEFHQFQLKSTVSYPGYHRSRSNYPTPICIRHFHNYSKLMPIKLAHSNNCKLVLELSNTAPQPI